MCIAIAMDMHTKAKSMINLTKNTMHYSKTKHIEVKHRFIRGQLSRGDIELNHVESMSNLVKNFTKPLLENKFNYLRRNLVCDA